MMGFESHCLCPFNVIIKRIIIVIVVNVYVYLSFVNVHNFTDTESKTEPQKPGL